MSLITNTLVLQELRKATDQEEQIETLNLSAFYYLLITLANGFFLNGFQAIRSRGFEYSDWKPCWWAIVVSAIFGIYFKGANHQQMEGVEELLYIGYIHITPSFILNGRPKLDS